MDTCGWCGLGLHCIIDNEESPTAEDYWNNELLYCVPQDGFVNGDDGVCSKYIDECEFLLTASDGRDHFTV